MVKILENKVELVKENLSYDDVLSKIEQATRLCYRSKRSETREQREKEKLYMECLSRRRT